MFFLKQNQNDVLVSELCREHGMSRSQFYKSRSKYYGMDTNIKKRIMELEE